VQNRFGTNVQNYIITSRVAQGYEEWMQSSGAEKQDVIDRWRFIQKDLKKKQHPEKTTRGGAEVQQRESMGERTASVAQSLSSAPPLIEDHANAMVPMSRTDTAAESVQTNGIIRRPVPFRPVSEQVSSAAAPESLHNGSQQSTLDSPGIEHSETISDEQQEAQQDGHQPSSQPHESTAQNDGQECHIRAGSFASDSSSLAPAALDTYAHLSDSDWVTNSAVDDDASSTMDQERGDTGDATAQSGSALGMSSGSRHPPVYDQAHLGGTTQSAFKAQQHSQQGEKTARERTEEEIVMEYVKKQSLLEVHHKAKRKGKGRATVAEDGDDDDGDMQKALEASLRGHELHGEEHRGDRL